MYVLTAEQMQQVDTETIDRVCPGIELMERAGRCVTQVLLHHYHDAPPKAAIFVGSGNNGGDGLVIARLLAQDGWTCSVHLLKSPDSFTADARKNYQRLSELPEAADRIVVHPADRSDWVQTVEADLADTGVIVDAIFGTGVSGAPRDRALEMIEVINESGLPVVSVDVPSGVQGSTGETPGLAVMATETVTIGAPKTGLLFYPGKSHAGEVAVVDIGFPDEIIEKYADDTLLLDISEAAYRLPQRPPNIHKFKAGAALVVAGSRQYRGAALLAGEAALRAGCGMVYLGVPASIRDGIDVALREVITIPLPETVGGTVALGGLEALKKTIGRVNAIAVGPGMGRDRETDVFIRHLVAGTDKPIVIDADGITAFRDAVSDLATVEAPTILTPHTGELARLLDRVVPETPLERIETTRSIAAELGTTLVHKGAPSLVAAAAGPVWINTSGSSALASGGTGDVLTGLVAGLLAQGASPEDAACTATYVHGKAGEMAAEDLGNRGTIAGDLLHTIGPALLQLETITDE